MEVIKIITDFFLVSMAFCYTLFSPIASSSLTGNGFIKLISNVSLGLLAIALIVNPHSGLEIKIITAVAIVLVTLFHADDKNWAMWILYSLVVGLLGTYLFLKWIVSFFFHNFIRNYYLCYDFGTLVFSCPKT
jgi:hypothetical protein